MLSKECIFTPFPILAMFYYMCTWKLRLFPGLWSIQNKFHLNEFLVHDQSTLIKYLHCFNYMCLHMYVWLWILNDTWVALEFNTYIYIWVWVAASASHVYELIIGVLLLILMDVCSFWFSTHIYLHIYMSLICCHCLTHIWTHILLILMDICSILMLSYLEAGCP